MINSINNNISFQEIYNRYSNISSKKAEEPTETEETTDETEQTTEETIDSMVDANKETKASYNMSFEQRAQVQQQMQMESLIQQFTLANQAINSDDTGYIAPLDTEAILGGQQVATQIGVISTSVDATTQEKNDYITERVSGTDSAHKEESTDETTDETNTDETTDVEHETK